VQQPLGAFFFFPLRHAQGEEPACGRWRVVVGGDGSTLKSKTQGPRRTKQSTIVVFVAQIYAGRLRRDCGLSSSSLPPLSSSWGRGGGPFVACVSGLGEWG
jgi:hypothetical protein